MQKFDIFDIHKCVTHGEKCYAFNVRMSGAGDEQTQMKFVEDSGGVHLRVVLNEIVFDNVVGAGKPIQSLLGPLPVNMASLGSQVLFMALFIYFSYKVYSSVHKFQRQGIKLHLVFTVVP